jgi:hypothetical protein
MATSRSAGEPASSDASTSTSNVSAQSRSPLEGQEASLAAAYLGGATVRDLVERFGANQRTIRKVLAEQGVEMRRPGRKPA